MARKFPNMPKNSMNMMKQAQKMQQDMLAMQEELENRQFSATSGGGMVTATVTGKNKLIGLQIDPEAVDPDDVEMLEDMIIAAVGEAMKKAEEATEAEMAKITGGLNLPGLF